MTSETTAPNSSFDARELLANLRAGLAMVMKVIMGGMVVVAAGILAVAVAMVGLILTAVAVIYRMIAGKPHATQTVTSDEGGVILDARETPHGWTVE